MELLLLAQLAQPVPKLGPCPLGYYSQNSYCVPLPTAAPTIEKVGATCPLGWLQNIGYCTQIR